MKYRRKYRPRRRTTRRRRSYAKRRATNQSQRFFKHRMTFVVPIKLSGALPLDYSVGFAWQQPGGLTSAIYGFDNSPRWANTYKNYE